MVDTALTNPPRTIHLKSVRRSGHSLHCNLRDERYTNLPGAFVVTWTGDSCLWSGSPVFVAFALCRGRRGGEYRPLPPFFASRGPASKATTVETFVSEAAVIERAAEPIRAGYSVWSPASVERH